MKSFIFWDTTPCSMLKVNRRFRGTSRLHFQGRRISQVRSQSQAASKQSFYSAYSWTLKMVATCSSETSVDFQRTTRRYIPEAEHLVQILYFWILSIVLSLSKNRPVYFSKHNVSETGFYLRLQVKPTHLAQSIDQFLSLETVSSFYSSL
jgi:hypothetical protein